MDTRKWHRWYAWHPVEVRRGSSYQWVWLEEVARRFVWHYDGFTTEYIPIGDAK